MKAFTILILIYFYSSVAYSQENTISWKEDQRLQWEDFSGKEKDTSAFDAEACAEVKYYYRFDNPRNFKFDVVASFNRNTSWSKKEHQSDELLQHEQLHFDIAELYARKIKDMFENFSYSKNFAAEVKWLFERKKAEYHTMQQQYDKETNHSLNKNKQQEWETYIHNELSKWQTNDSFEWSIAKNNSGK